MSTTSLQQGKLILKELTIVHLVIYAHTTF